MHSLRTDYRPDYYPEWIPWREFDDQRFNLIGIPSALGAGGVPTARPGFYPRLSFGKPQNACDSNTERNTRRGFEFQIRFRGTGHVVLDRFRLHAQKLVEKSRASC